MAKAESVSNENTKKVMIPVPSKAARTLRIPSRDGKEWENATQAPGWQPASYPNMINVDFNECDNNGKPIYYLVPGKYVSHLLK
jgi:hypothetical protein